MSKKIENKIENVNYNICRGAYNGCRASKKEGLFYKYSMNNSENCWVKLIKPLIGRLEKK